MSTRAAQIRDIEAHGELELRVLPVVLELERARGGAALPEDHGAAARPRQSSSRGGEKTSAGPGVTSCRIWPPATL